MQQSREKLYFEKALKSLMPYIEAGTKVVDIDPKQGIYSREFHRAGFQVTGVYPVGQPALDNPFIMEMMQKEIEDVLLPYNSVGAIWAHQSLNGITKEQCLRRLSLFYDWLQKKGVVYFALLEGDGYKMITEQGVTGPVHKLVVYYHPQEIEEMLGQLGYEVLEAWRDPQQDRSWINVIAIKNSPR